MKKKFNVIDKLIIFEISMILIIGKIKIISTSKIKKIIAIKKNWIENGKRELFLGSNPHSKGEFFSLSKNVFFEIIFKISTKKNTINIEKAKNVIAMKIIYTRIRFFDWKSNIIFILCKYLPHQ